ncbi:hypothetical protein ACD578_05230 [Microvirga sp. RSM25]|uniref:hypothetical protein n=1 Tax=Microvirga sp. RSM25 TaxID=3273802 RepID=UPI00384BC9DB
MRQALEADRKAFDGMTRVLDEIELERRRQVEEEGWTPRHDDQHARGEMAAAAYCYIGEVCWRRDHPDAGRCDLPPPDWPWSREWWKPKGDRRNLVRAAALIVAEIERTDREEARQCG